MALPLIVRLSPIPVIADIHFNASLALEAIDAGVHAVRINPGNIGGPDKTERVVRAAKRAGIPMRIGANAGSLPSISRSSRARTRRGPSSSRRSSRSRSSSGSTPRLQDLGQGVARADDDPRLSDARRSVPYPLHLGVTEAGTPFSGSIKSAVGMGALLMDGIGDTLRVSVTADPVKEVEVAWEILKALGLRERGPVMIASPRAGGTTSASRASRSSWRSAFATIRRHSRSP